MQIMAETKVEPGLASFNNNRSPEDIVFWFGEFFARQVDLGGLYRKTVIIEMMARASPTSLPKSKRPVASLVLHSLQRAACHKELETALYRVLLRARLCRAAPKVPKYRAPWDLGDQVPPSKNSPYLFPKAPPSIGLPSWGS